MSPAASERAGGIRTPAAAGLFYPADAAGLAEAVDALLSAAERSAPPTDGRPRAVIVPHAGYRYSGRVAAAAYAACASARGRWPARAVLVGPAHFVRPAGCAVPRTAAWRTPLGLAPIDATLRDRALALSGVRADDAPHAREHALEVQLPFLARAAGAQTPVLPVAAHAPPSAVADLLEAVTDADTLVIASTDLSHYLPDAEARKRDASTIDSVLRLRPDLIADHAACGAHALRGLLTWAGRADLRPRLLAYATSADAGGGPERVVGYAAFALG